MVGVLGAAHVKGIQARWEQAGSPETARQVAEYCTTDAGPLGALSPQAGVWVNLSASKHHANKSWPAS